MAPKKTFLIAGGNSGIGFESVSRLSGLGHTLHCALRNPDKITSLPGTTTHEFDATDPNRLPAELPESLDGLVYFPGTINLKPFHGFSDDEFLNDLQINFLGAARLIRHVLPALKKSGNASIVLFSTVAVQTGMPFHASISAAKGAVEGLTRSLAAEFSPKIRVNAIAPSLTETPLAGNLVSSEEKIKTSADRHPLKRIGDPKEIAALVEYLLGDDSGFMTGQILKIDGGIGSLKLL